MKTLAVIQARMGSSRLPGKVLKDLSGQPMLRRIWERVSAIDSVDRVVVATSIESQDDAIEAFCSSNGYDVYRGSEGDVLDRYFEAAKKYSAENVMRVTADCPFVGSEEADKVILAHVQANAEYSHNITVMGSMMPLGTGVEVFSYDALENSWKNGHEKHHREHVDEFILENQDDFKIVGVTAPPELQRPDFRLTVDATEDFSLISDIVSSMKCGDLQPKLSDVVKFLDENPGMLDINNHIEQKRI